MATDALFGKFPKPPCAELLGLTLLDHNAGERWARFSFEGSPEFLNPAGFIQGGILAAMPEGVVVSMGKTIAFMEATMSDAEGTPLARATGSARLVPVEKLPAQPR